MAFPKSVSICDVGTRDGFQAEHDFVPTAAKIEVIDALVAAGLRKLEVTSFVSPRAVPQMADATEVLAGIDKTRGAEFVCLVPNLRGAENAIRAGARAILLFVSASETHNGTNVNRPIAASLDGFRAIMDLALRDGITVHGSISTAFGCPFEGDVPPAQVASVARAMHAMGIGHIALGDTTGMGTPPLVRAAIEAVRDTCPELRLALHFHNTRGLGLVNIVTGLELGITDYEGSVGGLGGCPFAPGATGNVCTEDMVNLMHELGIETGIDLDALCGVARRVETLVGRSLPGQVMRAGPRGRLSPLDRAVRAIG
jgi:hydroxymethylglutaryl-CoA lyase